MAISKQTRLLLTVAIILAALLILDDTDISSNDTRPSSRTRHIADYTRLIMAEKRINQEYQTAALPYAERAALLETFVTEKIDDPGQTMETILRQLLQTFDVSIKNLTVATPEKIGEGVYWGEIDIEIISFSSNTIWNTLIFLADKQRGISWINFDLKTKQDKKSITLSGRLAMVLIQAVE